MYRPDTERRFPRRGQAGYALVLVMVALVTLTILGVTSITASQLDMKITQNMRHYKALQYGALTGADHARDVFESEPEGTVVELWRSVMGGETDHCWNDWISTEVGAAWAPMAIEANGFPLAAYTVDLCPATCGTPLAGTDLGNSQSSIHHVSTDMVATGGMQDSTAGAQAAAVVLRNERTDCI